MKRQGLWEASTHGKGSEKVKRNWLVRLIALALMLCLGAALAERLEALSAQGAQ